MVNNELVTTQAIIIRHVDVGEQDRLYHLYTRNHGRILAKALGVRLMKSKLRYILQDGGCCSVSIIEGRNGYRLINAYSDYEIMHNLTSAGRSLLLLVDRLIQGEERDEELFDLLKKNIFKRPHELISTSAISEKDIYLFGAYSLLFRLGYIAPEENVKKILTKDLNEDIISQFHSYVPNSSALIRERLTSTHL